MFSRLILAIASGALQCPAGWAQVAERVCLPASRHQLALDAEIHAAIDVDKKLDGRANFDSVDSMRLRYPMQGAVLEMDGALRSAELGNLHLAVEANAARTVGDGADVMWANTDHVGTIRLPAHLRRCHPLHRVAQDDVAAAFGDGCRIDGRI